MKVGSLLVHEILPLVVCVIGCDLRNGEPAVVVTKIGRAPKKPWVFGDPSNSKLMPLTEAARWSHATHADYELAESGYIRWQSEELFNLLEAGELEFQRGRPYIGFTIHGG